MVSTAGSSREGQEWISPNCLLQSVKGVKGCPRLRLVPNTPPRWAKRIGTIRFSSLFSVKVGVGFGRRGGIVVSCVAVAAVRTIFKVKIGTLNVNCLQKFLHQSIPLCILDRLL